MRVRLILLALLGSMLAAFGSTPTAAAATVVPCVRTFAGPAKAIAPETSPTTGSAYTWTTTGVTLPALSNVEDIDATFDITHPHASNLSIRLTRMEGATVTESIALHGRFAAKVGAEPRPLTFDDEAAGPYGVASATGRYQPYTAMSAFDGSAVQATWRLDVANFENITTAKINSWSVRISLTTCDADGDGAEEHSDNCAGLANADQLDLDGDGLGNACDADLDGDGVINPADNCLTVANPDQADADLNAVGDACNADDDGDAHEDTVDGCPLAPAATASGCPTIGRTLSIKWVHKRKSKRITGSVASGLPGCRAEVEVTLWHKRRGADRRLVVVRTDDAGRYRVRSPRDAGKYYVTVPMTYLAHVAECAPGRSSSARVRR